MDAMSSPDQKQTRLTSPAADATATENTVAGHDALASQTPSNDSAGSIGMASWIRVGWVALAALAAMAVGGATVAWLRRGPLPAETALSDRVATPQASVSSNIGPRGKAFAQDPSPSADASATERSGAPADLPTLPDLLPAGVNGFKRLAAEQPLPQTVAEIYREAEQTVDQLLLRYPKNVDCRETKARLLLAMGKSGAAEEEWKQALKLNPNYAYAYDGLATVAAKRGDVDGAVRLLQKSLGLAPNSAKTSLEASRLLVQLGRSNEAVENLRKLVSIDPRSAEGHLLLGEALLRKQDYPGAKQAYARAAALSPEYPPAWHGLGTAYQRLNLPDEAKQHLQKSFQLRAKLLATSDTKVVFSDLRAARREVARIYTNAGRVDAVLGNAVEAERLWRRAAALDPEQPESRYQLAAFLLRSGRLPEAAGVVRDLAATSTPEPLHGLNLAVLYARLGQLDEAEATLTKCRQRHPEESWPYRESARFLVQTGRRPEEAVRLARHAVALEPIATNFSVLAEACLRSGDRTSAHTAISKARQLDPTNPIFPRLLQQIESTP